MLMIKTQVLEVSKNLRIDTRLLEGNEQCIPLALDAKGCSSESFTFISEEIDLKKRSPGVEEGVIQSGWCSQGSAMVYLTSCPPVCTNKTHKSHVGNVVDCLAESWR